jgi:hypothetical protein
MKAQTGRRGIPLLFRQRRRCVAVGGQRRASAALPPGKRPGIHCTGGWVGPRVGVDGCGKCHHLPGFDPQTVQPLASCYNALISVDSSDSVAALLRILTKI